DCQDFSLDGGRDRSWSPSWAKQFSLSGIRDELGMSTRPSDEEHVGNVRDGVDDLGLVILGRPRRPSRGDLGQL
ncbi:hypothetical protein A2U01_0053968, partial [Trifolium medium]|nr:hypothetical protein [Trifolium medium]